MGDSYRYTHSIDSLRSEMLGRFDRMDRKLNWLVETWSREMAKAIDDLKAEVQENTTVVESAVTLLNGLSEALKNAINSGDLAEVEKVVADLDANTKRLADAVSANTPAAPPTEPAPDPNPSNP